MKRWHKSDAFIIFSASLSLRLLLVLVTTLTEVNTYSQSDADGFASQANQIATTVTSGATPSLNLDDIYQLWGTMLSPFWVLPGPSRIYARIGMAILGAVAVYNVYSIARHYYSKAAGTVCIIPMVFYPSFLFVHATVLREVMVLFCLTTATRLLFLPTRYRRITQYVGAGILLSIASVLREENIPVYLLVISIAIIVKWKPWKRYDILSKIGATSGTLIGLVSVYMYGPRVLDRLMTVRRYRARGRTEYLGTIFPDTILTAVAFSWIGASYFLFSPFPWMLANIMDFVIMLESFGNLLYAIAAVLGVKIMIKKIPSGVAALLTAILVGSVLYGYGTANVGTAVRHRQMVTWAIYLFGGIGITSCIQFKIDD